MNATETSSASSPTPQDPVVTALGASCLVTPLHANRKGHTRLGRVLSVGPRFDPGVSAGDVVLYDGRLVEKVDGYTCLLPNAVLGIYEGDIPIQHECMFGLWVAGTKEDCGACNAPPLPVEVADSGLGNQATLPPGALEAYHRGELTKEDLRDRWGIPIEA